MTTSVSARQRGFTVSLYMRLHSDGTRPAMRRGLTSVVAGLALLAAVMSGAGPAAAAGADLATLSGMVSLADGSPVVDATLVFEYTEMPAKVPVLTDANGHFSMLVAAGRPGSLVLYGYDPTDPQSVAAQPSSPPLPWGSQVHVNQFEVPSGGSTYQLTLPVVSSLAVRVVDGNAQGVNGAQVFCHSNGSLSFNTIPGGGYLLDPCMGTQGLLTGADGSLPLSVPFYQATSWYPAPELTALDPTNPSNSQTRPIDPDAITGTDTPFEMALGPVGDTGPLTTLSGVVTLPDGTPVRGATVRYSYPGTTVTTQTDPSGGYSLQVAPGLGELHVLSNDPTEPRQLGQDPSAWSVTHQPTPPLPYRLDLKVDVFAVPSAGLDYDVILPKIDDVAVRILDATGAAVPWAKVVSSSAQSGTVSWPSGGASFTAAPVGARGITSDATGAIAATLPMVDGSITDAPVTLTATDPANPLNTVSEIVAINDGFTLANPLTLTLPEAAGPVGPFATVTGRAFLPDETPIAGALVRYRSYSSPAVFTTLTRSDGTYSLQVTAEQPGDIALYSNDPSDPSWWASAQPSPALPARFEFHTNVQSWDVPAAEGTSSFDFPLPDFHTFRVRVVDAADTTNGIGGARVYATGGTSQSLSWATGSGYYIAPNLSGEGLLTGPDGYLVVPFLTSATNPATGPVLLAGVDAANAARVDFLPHDVTTNDDVTLTLPNAPAAPATVGTGANVGTTSIDLTWAPASDTGGADLTGFTVSAQPGAQGAAVRSAAKTGLAAKSAATSGDVTKVIYDPTAVGTTLTGLVPGTTYVVSVRSMNPIGLSSPTIVIATTGGAAASAPESPRDVTAVADDASATVSWAPGAANGSAIQQFTVMSSPGSQTCIGGANDTSCVVTGLANGTPYTFTVVATNGIGTSAPSIESPVVTPAATVHLSRPVRTVTGFTVNVTNYDPGLRYTAVASSGRVSKGKVTAGILPLTVKGLEPGASATVTVTASSRKTAVMSGTVAGAALIETTLTYTGPTMARTGSTVSLSAQLTQSASASPAADEPVTFTFNNRTLSATTDAAGVANVSAPTPTRSGAYAVAVSFDGDAARAASSARDSIRVRK